MSCLKDIRGITLSALLLAAVALPKASLAVLGQDATSVQNDAVRMRGALRTTTRASYTLHEITAGGGTVVREYISPQGKVFGVSWHGPVLPDLQQLLGPHYAAFQEAVHSRQYRIRGPVAVHTPGVVIQSAGHMRNFMGR